MFCFCAAQLKFWFKTDLARENSASYYRRGRQELLTLLTMATRWSRSTSNFYALIGHNFTGELIRKIYAASRILFTMTAEADRVLRQLVMFLTFFFHWDVQNEFSCYISGVFCYSWLVCLLGFWLRNTSLGKVGNPISDGIVFVLHLAWCERGLQSLKRYWPFLISFRAASLSLSNNCIWCFSFISNLMKSSVVYAAIYFMHVCKIWDNDLTE